jgi:hypothetical protein
LTGSRAGSAAANTGLADAFAKTFSAWFQTKRRALSPAYRLSVIERPSFPRSNRFVKHPQIRREVPLGGSESVSRRRKTTLK